MSTNRPNIRTRSAFTLIELLVVIAIIAILAAILFPVFAQAREKARAASCLSNQKQLALAMVSYSQDYDETYPMANWNNRVAWDTMVHPYTSSGRGGGTLKDNMGKGGDNVLACPSDSIERKASIYTDGEGTVTMAGAITRRSYALPATINWGQGFDNIEASGQGFQPMFKNEGRTLAAIPSPAELFMIVEAHNNENVPMEPQKAVAYGLLAQYVQNPGSGDQCDSIFWGGSQAQTEACYKSVTIPHNKGFNYAFADGHVKWLRPEATTGKTSIYNRWPSGGYWTLGADD